MVRIRVAVIESVLQRRIVRFHLVLTETGTKLHVAVLAPGAQLFAHGLPLVAAVFVAQHLCRFEVILVAVPVGEFRAVTAPHLRCHLADIARDLFATRRNQPWHPPLEQLVAVHDGEELSFGEFGQVGGADHLYLLLLLARLG